MEIGKKILRIRKDKNLTIRDLSALCGIQISTLSVIEQGKRNVGVETAERILNSLGYKLVIAQKDDEDGK